MRLLSLVLLMALTSCAGTSYIGDGYYADDGTYINYDTPKSTNFMKNLFSGKSGYYEEVNGELVFIEVHHPSVFKKYAEAEWVPIWRKRN